MANAPNNTLTISFPEEAYKLLAEGNAADPINHKRVVLNINYFEDVRDEKERKAEAPPELVARSIRLPLESPGNTTVVVGEPEDEKISISLLKSDGSAFQTEILVLDKNKAKYAITITDIKNLAKAEIDPIEATIKRTTRNAQLVPIGSVTPDFKKSKLAIFTVNKDSDIAGNSALGAFGFSKERTSSVELDPQLATALQAVTWNHVALGIDGRFNATFDQPILKPGGDAEKSLGWVWWLSGISSAAGFVKDDVSKLGRTPTIIALPAMQPISGAKSEAEDCACDTPIKQLPRDVTEAELVNNPDVYAEDPGTFCKPFSNPNRVISEKAFAVVSRVDTPDISPLPSARLRSTHLLDLETEGQISVGTDPRGGRIVVMQPPTKELLMSALLSTKVPKRYKEPASIVQQTKQMPSGRTDVTADHPVQWEDDIAQYQAATVALGHILEFRMRTRSAGYSLGNVASTLTLAPRQTKRIQKVEFDRLERARRDERTQQTDSVSDEVTRERDYNDTVAAYLSEWATGSSSSGTAAAAGGFGFSIPPVIGGAGGGTSKAWSDSSQEGSRNTGASEQQRLRDAIRRHGDALRRFQSTVVSEVTQQETVTGTTEVLRNVNYGHSLTVIYYQILRHLKVSTEFAGVRECLYVPFAIKPFTLQRTYRWREAIQKYLRIPRFNKVMTHLRDVITDFQYSNMAPGSRANQRLTYLRGSFYITLAIERPKDTDDGKYNATQWLPFSSFFGMPAYGIWAKLAEKAEALRDQLFQKEHAPIIAAKWTDKLTLAMNGKPVDADLTLASRYSFNQNVRVDFNVPSGLADTLTRQQLRDVLVKSLVPLPPGSVANVSRMTIRYGTANFQRTIEALSGLADLINPETGEADPGAQLTFPLDAWDNVNEREVLRNSVNEFIEHLNEHVEFYHKAIWWNMDRDRLFMMLDGFYVPGSKNVSIASVVDREPIAIMGNSLVYRVGAGHFIGLPKITTPSELYNLYVGREPAQDDLRVSLPTDGLYAQTIMDECLALEEHQGSVDWVLEDPDPELGTIDPSLMISRRADLSSTIVPTTMPSTIINLQNAPDAPAPTGLSAALTAAGNANAFRDMAGLAGTQANAAAALQTAASLANNFGNQAAALKMAEMAKNKQATEDVNRQMAAVQKAKNQGLISETEAAEHTNSMLEQMHTTRQNKPYDNPVLAEAIANASGQPGSVIESTTADGQVRVEMNDKESTYNSKNVAIDPWDFQPTLWFMDATVQQHYQTPECAADLKCNLNKDKFEVKRVPLPPDPPAPAPKSSWKLDLKTTGTGKVAITIEQRYATTNALLPTTGSAKANETLQLLADTLNAVRSEIAEIFNATLPSGKGGAKTDDGARVLQCLKGFSAAAPLNIMLVDTQEFRVVNAMTGAPPVPSVTPVTTKVWVNLSDIGNTARLEPAIRFTTDEVMGRNGQTQISELGLRRKVLHELLHVRLYRDNTGMEQAWALAKPKLAPVGSVNGNDLGERLVWHFLMAQEEMFVYDFVDRNIPLIGGKPSSIIPSYAKWRARAKNCFLTHGAKMNTQNLNIPVSFKVGAKKVTWAFNFEFPSGYNFTDKDMPGLDRVIDDFQKIN